MHATVASVRHAELPLAPIGRRRHRAAAPEPVRSLPMQVSAGVRVAAPKWMFIVGGGALGGLLFGLPGAIGGALVGAFLAR